MNGLRRLLDALKGGSSVELRQARGTLLCDSRNRLARDRRLWREPHGLWVPGLDRRNGDFYGSVEPERDY